MMLGDIVLGVGIILVIATAASALAGVMMLDQKNVDYLGPFAMRIVAALAIAGMVVSFVGAVLKGKGI